MITDKGNRKRLRCTCLLSGWVRIISGVDHNHWNGWGRTPSTGGSQSLELGVSITGIHIARAEVLDVYFAQGVHGQNSLSTVGMDPQRSWKVALRTVLHEHHGSCRPAQLVL